MENGEVLYAAYNAIPNIDAVRLKDRDDIDVTTDGYSMINPMALIEFNTKEGRSLIQLCVARFQPQSTVGS